MFKCGICNEMSAPREKATRVVVKTKDVIFPKRIDANKFKTRDGRTMVSDDPGGAGTQIVKEVLAHVGCRDASVSNEG